LLPDGSCYIAPYNAGENRAAPVNAPVIESKESEERQAGHSEVHNAPVLPAVAASSSLADRGSSSLAASSPADAVPFGEQSVEVITAAAASSRVPLLMSSMEPGS
jgi:hypothetical protein